MRSREWLSGILMGLPVVPVLAGVVGSGLGVGDILVLLGGAVRRQKTAAESLTLGLCYAGGPVCRKGKKVKGSPGVSQRSQMETAKSTNFPAGGPESIFNWQYGGLHNCLTGSTRWGSLSSDDRHITTSIGGFMPLTEIAMPEPVPEDYHAIYFFKMPSKRSLHIITVKPPNILMQGQMVGGEELDRSETNFVLDWVQEVVDEIRAELRYRAGILDLPPLNPPGGKEGE